MIMVMERHITSTTGSIGAAAACSNLLHLAAPQTAHGIGLAATQPSVSARCSAHTPSPSIPVAQHRMG